MVTIKVEGMPLNVFKQLLDPHDDFIFPEMVHDCYDLQVSGLLMPKVHLQLNAIEVEDVFKGSVTSANKKTLSLEADWFQNEW